MYFDTLFLVALQSALVLGLIHGVNPCGHSWVVLAPFVVGEARGRRVAALTMAFILGTSLGCLAIGLILGLLATSLPESTRVVADLVTAVILLGLGAVLLWRPELLHGHEPGHEPGHEHGHCRLHGPDHDHDHEHDHYHHHDHHHGHDPAHDHDPDHDHDAADHGHDHHDHHDHHNDQDAPVHSHQHGFLRGRATTAWGLGGLGFVNMIVPCPTVAILYSYGLNAASPSKAVAVFGVYALATGAALAGVILAIYKVTGLMRRMQKPWIEPLVMRLAGLMTVGFGAYSLYTGLNA